MDDVYPLDPVIKKLSELIRDNLNRYCSEYEYPVADQDQSEKVMRMTRHGASEYRRLRDEYENIRAGLPKEFK